jgi:hypothetical protein
LCDPHDPQEPPPQPEQLQLLCEAMARPSLAAKKRETLRLVAVLLHLAQAIGESD